MEVLYPEQQKKYLLRCMEPYSTVITNVIICVFFLLIHLLKQNNENLIGIIIVPVCEVQCGISLFVYIHNV
jgi:hypothetical protein